MTEPTSTFWPSSPRPCSERTELLTCADLPGLVLARGQESGPGLPRHAHASLVLGLALTGERVLSTCGGEVRAPAGTGFAIPPGLIHATRAAGKGPCAYLALCLDPSVHALPALAEALALSPGALTETLATLAQAVEQPAGALERQSLLAHALELLNALRPEAPLARPDGLLAQAVERARALLEEGLAENRGWPDIAAACEAEAPALHRAFVRAVGLPPHLYQTHLRLRRAKELLRAGADLSGAALEAGFCDQSHMHRHFVRLVGLTPAQYARAFRAAKP